MFASDWIRTNFRVATVRVLAGLCVCCLAAAGTGTEGRQALDNGAFETAARLFEARLTEDAPLEARCAALLGLGDSYREAGRPRRARTYYEQAIALGEPAHCLTRARIGLGMALYLDGELLTARDTLAQALTEARQTGQPELLSMALNASAGVFAAGNRFGRARDHFAEAIALEKASPLMRAQAHAGIAFMAITRGEDAGDEIAAALRLLERAPDTFRKADLLLNLADVDMTPRRAALTEKALAVGRKLDNAYLESAALGRAGSLAAARSDPDSARAFTERALFLAQSIQNAELLYLWNWQMGRLRSANAPERAIRSYRLAMDSFELIRDELIRRYRFEQKDFRERFGSFFLEYARLLMNQSTRGEETLRQARSVIEAFKTAELQDYFLDDCVSAAQQTAALSAEKGVVIIYPVIHPDRLDILMESDKGLSYRSVPVTGRELTATLNRFRRQLQSFRAQYGNSARTLYEWLITPIKAQLASAQVLVVVPDAALRLVPFTALHDGEQFLIEQHAVAVTPGLSVTMSGSGPESSRILLAGLTEDVQGYRPLPGARREIALLQELYDARSRVLIDDEFSAHSIRRALIDQPVKILHLASHAEFGGDRQDSFVLTHDGRLDLDELESLVRYSGAEGTLAMLTLAACQTAMGNDRAALGLAGVAVKAGAASALATLWSVGDQSAAELTVAFYRGLERGLSRAQALREAQLQLLGSEAYRHPGHWSAFMLIGDWH